jgi:nucleotide-binding universal stress UspA family protein
VIDGLSAARALQQAAEAARVGLLVVGAGRGKVLGSTAQRLLHGASCPVAVVRREWRPRPLRTIGAAVADATSDLEVIDAAHVLARLALARLRVLTVVRVTAEMYARTQPQGAVRPAQDIDDEHTELATRELQRAVAALGDVPVDVAALVGDPAEKLVEVSDQLDVLVCGSRGYGRVRAVLLGSVSRRLVADAHCPVIVLPRGVSGQLETLVAGETSAAGGSRDSDGSEEVSAPSRRRF